MIEKYASIFVGDCSQIDVGEGWIAYSFLGYFVLFYLDK